MTNVNTVLTKEEVAAICVSVMALEVNSSESEVSGEGTAAYLAFAQSAIEKLGITKQYEWHRQNFLQFLNKNLQ